MFVKQELNILLVDDNPDHVKIIIWALEQSDIKNRVTVIDDGKKAIEVLDSLCNPDDMFGAPPDLIFLDLNLPKKSGFEVLNHIKKNPALKHLPVVIMSSSDTIEDVRAAYASGANTYISKDRIFNEIGEAVNKVCQYWATVAQLPTRR